MSSEPKPDMFVSVLRGALLAIVLIELLGVGVLWQLGR
jgi:hypothetical protein